MSYEIGLCLVTRGPGPSCSAHRTVLDCRTSTQLDRSPLLVDGERITVERIDSHASECAEDACASSRELLPRCCWPIDCDRRHPFVLRCPDRCSGSSSVW